MCHSKISTFNVVNWQIMMSLDFNGSNNDVNIGQSLSSQEKAMKV
jgi:hypothetical protein